MPTYDASHLDEQSSGLARAAGLIALVFCVGVVGYSIIGGDRYSLVDAVYMTMITLTTVGYGEVIDLSGNPGGRMFTAALLFVGVGSFVYFFSNLTAFMVEGNLDRFLWRRKMRRSISALDKHFIICGAGRTGSHMIRELIATERPFVLIDLDEARARQLRDELEAAFPVIIGDATDEEVLQRAGIDRATGLCATIANDKDNLLITMTARMLRPSLRIVARCTDQKIQQKLRRAGADAVVSPNVIGGLRLVSELIRPDAVTFLDTMLRDKDKRLRVEELQIGAEAKARGRSVGALRADKLGDVLIIALRHGGAKDWTFHPDDAMTVETGCSVVFMGSPEGRRLAEERWG